MDKILVIAIVDNSIIFDGYIEDIPQYGYYCDIFEEYNKGKEEGITQNNWKWRIY
jgi:hypothetical protein